MYCVYQIVILDLCWNRNEKYFICGDALKRFVLSWEDMFFERASLYSINIMAYFTFKIHWKHKKNAQQRKNHLEYKIFQLWISGAHSVYCCSLSLINIFRNLTRQKQTEQITRWLKKTRRKDKIAFRCDNSDIEFSYYSFFLTI